MKVYAGTTSLAVAFTHLAAPLTGRSLSSRSILGSSVSLASAVGAAGVAAPTAAELAPRPTRHYDGDNSGVLASSRQERKRARKTRSYRRRQAPITRGQRRTLRELWPKYGLVGDFAARWKFEDIFSNSGAVHFDIGFGSGESLIEMATRRPSENFVGIEVHKPGVASALAGLEAGGLENVRIVQGDAITALTDHVEDRSLTSCCIFFPDPFPQERDSERRLVRPLLLSLLSSKLRWGGMLHVATDVEGYAEHTKKVLNASPRSTDPATSVDEGQDKLFKPSPSSSSPPPSRRPRATAATKTTPATLAAAAAAAAAAAKVDRLEYPGEERCFRRGQEQTSSEATAADDSRRRQPQEQRQGTIGEESSTSRLSPYEVSGRWVGGEASERPSWRPLTKYEEKAREAGRRVWDFSYRLEPRADVSRAPATVR